MRRFKKTEKCYHSEIDVDGEEELTEHLMSNKIDIHAWKSH